MKPFRPRQSAGLLALDSRIRKLGERERSPDRERKLGDCYREVIRLYRQVASHHPDLDTDAGKRLRHLACLAMRYLGGEGDQGLLSLKNYNHRRYGPYLGVSDEGSAAPVIRRAVLGSPKSIALKTSDPMVAGAAVDAERLGGVGETAVGPDEYINVRLECMGRILSSTNVGTRVNLRFYRRHRVVKVAKGNLKRAIEQAKKDIRAAFEPFLRAPGGRPRPLTVFVKFEDGARLDESTRVSLLKELLEYARLGEVADRSVHRLGYQVRIPPRRRGRDAAIRAIDTAGDAGIREVALTGRVRPRADEYISYPGLLNYLAPGFLGPVLRHANRRGIEVRPVNRVDSETVARHVWSSLYTARQMGYELGKYGLFPLTLEESDVVVGRIQSWLSDWTAAPVFFVDQGLVSATRVDTNGDLLRGLKTWLQMVAKHRVSVVLIDTVDKSKNMPLLGLPGESKGFMTIRNIADVDRLAQRLGIKTLWAGGITLPQAFVFGRLGVFGIYVTSAASSPTPVPPEYETDPWLAAVKEPTFEGVFRTKILLEAGFLSVRLENPGDGQKLQETAQALIKALQEKNKKEIKSCEEALVGLLISAWHRFRPGRRRPAKTDSPVPDRR